jgi:hypothetical protein
LASILDHRGSEEWAAHAAGALLDANDASRAIAHPMGLLYKRIAVVVAAVPKMPALCQILP